MALIPLLHRRYLVLQLLLSVEARLILGWTTNPEPDVAHYNVYRGTTAGFAVNTATDTPLAQPMANSYSNTLV